ncbi:hypothetical protein ACA910_020910 [Epithemia clementina (nom. ined.)]
MTASPDNNLSIKKVAFADDHRTILIEQIEELDVESIWFTPDDYFEIKAQTRLDSKEWRRKGYGVLLKETFENPLEEAQEYLNAFCQLEDDLTRRGLERHLSRRHGEERSDLKDRARYCVLSHQRKLKRDGKKLHEMEDQLAKIYEDICRCAKVFARRIAKADELVVTEGCTNEPADKIVDESEVVEGGRKMERRMSNYSVKSGNSLDSFRMASSGGGTPLARSQKGSCPSSPASPPEEYYAAIA